MKIIVGVVYFHIVSYINGNHECIYDDMNVCVGSLNLTGVSKHNQLGVALLCCISTSLSIVQRHEFADFVHVPPVSLLKLEPTTYMLIVGLIEVACAGLIAVGKHPYSKFATWALAVVMLGALYTHYSVHHPLAQCVPALVCFSLAMARLYTMGALHQVEVKVKL